MASLALTRRIVEQEALAGSIGDLTGLIAGAGVAILNPDGPVPTISVAPGSITGQVERRVLAAGEIVAKALTLSTTPTTQVAMGVVGGTWQREGTDYSVAGAVVSWAGTPLEADLVIGDVLIFVFGI